MRGPKAVGFDAENGAMPAKVETALGEYLKQIKGYALLSAEEERDLALKIRARAEAERKLATGEIGMAEYDRAQREAAQARDRMVQANLRLVISVAKNFRNRGLPMEDLVNEGNVGLMNAVDRYDPDVGSRFSTYAGYWIDQAIRRAVQNAQQMIHIPSYLIENIGKMRLAHRELEENLGRSPSMNELAHHMGITARKAGAISMAIRACTSRMQGTATADGENTLNEALEDTRTPQPFDTIFTASDAEFVTRMLERITEREALVLELRYGLNDHKGRRMTLKQIGEKVGLTRERVRQIEREAKRKLEEYVKEYM
jgi:RNA polymerase primary sigma factor